MKNGRNAKFLFSSNKEIFDTEMWDISQAFNIAEQKTKHIWQPWVISIFCDSKAVINYFKRCESAEGQA